MSRHKRHAQTGTTINCPVCSKKGLFPYSTIFPREKANPTYSSPKLPARPNETGGNNNPPRKREL